MDDTAVRPALPGRGRRAAAPAAADAAGPQIRRLVLGMAVVVALTFGGFFTWAALASLASAVSAGGTVSVESHRKVIQHLEGGIVAELLVRDGDEIVAGQPLLRLEDVRPRADLTILEATYVMLAATKARLDAELVGAETLALPAAVEALATTDEARQHLENQRSLFTARRVELDNRAQILRQRSGEMQEQAAAIEAQQAAVAQQRRLIGEELAGTRELYQKGYAPKTKVLALERAAAELQGQAGSYAARLAETREGIARANLEILDLRNSRRSELAEQVRDTQSELARLSEEIAAARDTLARTVVRAPEAGVVQNLRIHTVGGVLPAGAPILDLVPQRDRLLMDVRVRPEDIEVVHVGQAAAVYLVPYQNKQVPPVDGAVVYVSADALKDEASGEPYYSARIELRDGALDGLGQEVTLHPGMPVVAMIILGERTVLEYFTAPFRRLSDFGMREE